MNTWQVCRQIKKLLEDRKWEGNAAYDPVFGAVRIGIPENEKALTSLRVPFALIRPQSGVVDSDASEEGNLIEQSIEILIAAMNEADNLGESSLIGANRSGGQGDSRGRGILEIEEEMFEAVSLLNGIDGVEIMYRAASITDASLDQNRKLIVFRGYLFEALLTTKRFYHPPTRLAAVDDGGGDTTLSWRLPPDRYDFNSSDPRGGLVLRRASGSTPPASETAGTGVSIASFATGVTDSPGPGTFSYSIFAGYDETGSGTNERFSSADARAQVTVTVT